MAIHFSPRRSFSVVICGFSVFFIGFIVGRWAFSQTADPENSDWKRKLVEKELGKIVLYDESHKLCVAYRPNKAGGVRRLNVINSDGMGPNFTLDFGEDGSQMAAEYSSEETQRNKKDWFPGSPGSCMIVWKDLNSDGIFDERYILGRSKILAVEAPRQYQIYTDGKWENAVRTDAGTARTTSGKEYYFEINTGRWIAKEKRK